MENTPSVASNPDAVPTVVADTVVDGVEFRHVRVVCPYCGHVHAHGWPLEDADVGLRGADCPTGGSYYVLAAPAHLGGGAR